MRKILIRPERSGWGFTTKENTMSKILTPTEVDKLEREIDEIERSLKNNYGITAADRFDLAIQFDRLREITETIEASMDKIKGGTRD